MLLFILSPSLPDTVHHDHQIRCSTLAAYFGSAAPTKPAPIMAQLKAANSLVSGAVGLNSSGRFMLRKNWLTELEGLAGLVAPECAQTPQWQWQMVELATRTPRNRSNAPLALNLCLILFSDSLCWNIHLIAINLKLERARTFGKRRCNYYTSSEQAAHASLAPLWIHSSKL